MPGIIYILGVSCFSHNSAASLLKDGKIVAAVFEERFSRITNDPEFPYQAIEFCLKKENILIENIDYVVFHEKPFLKFERTVFFHFLRWPKGLFSFHETINDWLKKKLRVAGLINKLGYKGPLLYVKHHESHAASVFFTSPFKEAAILTIDSFGEWTTTSIAKGRDNQLSILKEVRFPHSLGLLYSAFAYFLGFEGDEAGYKLMGLAPYGMPKYIDKIKDNLITSHSDGSFTLNQDYFIYRYEEKMINKKIEKLFDMRIRMNEEEITQKHKDIAKSVQVVLEDSLAALANNALDLVGSKNICLSGRVVLNCQANSKLVERRKFENIYIFAAPGDDGASAGAALFAWNHILGKDRTNGIDTIYLGPEFTDKEIRMYLDRTNIEYKRYNQEELVEMTASCIKNQKIIGWFQGAMEFAPQSLGNRSIIGDAGYKENWRLINENIKRGESFCPLPLSILNEDKDEYFDFPFESNYMLFTAQNKTDKLPATTHVDNSSIIHTVSKERNSLFHELISEVKRQTGIPALINTSFNMAGKPIVCTPQDAYGVFIKTKIDLLVMGNYIISKENIPWRNQ